MRNGYYLALTNVRFLGFVQIQSVNDMYKLLQEYNSSLQLYNSKLQGDLDEAHETIKRGEKERTAIIENIGNLKGQFSALQEQLAASKVIDALSIVVNVYSFGQNVIWCLVFFLARLLKKIS